MLIIELIFSSEEYWNDPLKFDPSRFEERHLEIHLPFSHGPRSCIGQNFAMLEAKIMLSHAYSTISIRNYTRSKTCSRYRRYTKVIIISITSSSSSSFFFSRPKYGMWMKVSSR